MPRSKRNQISVRFTAPHGEVRALTAAPGQSLRDLAVDHGVAGIEGICGGSCSCATCHVYVDAPWTSMIGPADSAEVELLDALENRKPESRLACQISLNPGLDGITVRVPGIF